MPKFSKLLMAGLIASIVLLTACGGDSRRTVVSSTGGDGINVNGQGTVYGSPDVVDVDIGVQVPAPTVAEAREKAGIAIDAVIKSIKANGVADNDVRTSQFSVDPQYNYGAYPGDPAYMTVKGFTVVNVLTIRIHKTDTVAKVVDDASAAGGNFVTVRRLAYGMLDQKKLQTQARDLAVKEAKERADELAALSGRKVGKVTQINESTTALQPNSPYSYYGSSAAAPVVTAARTGGGDTSIESGQLRVVVTVTVNYEIRD